MNKYYLKFKEPARVGDRDPFFEAVVSDVLNKIDEPKILTIGAERNLDPGSRYGDGWADYYWAELIQRKGKGKLVIIDISDEAIENCKVILGDFVGEIDINFIVDDGLNWINKDKWDLLYLDAGDVEWQTYEMFKKFDLRNGAVLLDDFGRGGKCERIKWGYPFYQLLQVNHVHQMGFYKKMDNYGDEFFKIENLILPYYRGWKGNREGTNNRAVEISLVEWFANKFDNIIEIGDVGAGYEIFKEWDVLDPFGPYLKSIRKDVLDYSYEGRNVVSVSTWEHLSEKAYQNDDPDKPMKALEKISKEAKNWLITFDVGADIYFQNWLMNQSEYQYTFMARDNWRGLINNWHQSDDKENFNLPYLHWEYNLDYYGNASVICIIYSKGLFDEVA